MSKNNQNKKQSKVYLNKDNINKLTKKDLELLKKQGRFTRCPDYLPHD